MLNLIRKITNRIKYFIELLFAEGSYLQVLAMASVIAFISLVGGLSAYYLTDSFPTFNTAWWWSFLRLTDPGYLGDDHGTLLRTISTVLTILGYVVFLGALIAMMTQWMYRVIKRLESGKTPLYLKDHILVLGDGEKVREVITELVGSKERVKKFIEASETGKLKIVLLTEKFVPEVLEDLKEELGPHWSSFNIMVRNGERDDINDLRIVSYDTAAAIIVPSSEGVNDFIHSDSDVLDCLMAISEGFYEDHGGDETLIVPEIYLPNTPKIMKHIHDNNIEIVQSGKIISRIVAQSIKYAGLAEVYMEMLNSEEGSELFIQEFPELVGCKYAEVEERFKDSLPIGFLKLLNPHTEESVFMLDREYEIRTGDKIVFIADDEDRIEVIPKENVIPLEYDDTPIRIKNQVLKTNLLIIGWSEICSLIIKEILNQKDRKYKIDVLDESKIDERNMDFQRVGMNPNEIKINHFQSYFSSPYFLKDVDLSKYQKIAFLADSFAQEEGPSLISYLYFSLKEALVAQNLYPEIVVVTKDPDKYDQLDDENCDLLVPRMISSHILAHVGLRRDLNDIFEELLGPEGLEIFQVKPEAKLIDQKIPVTFRQLKAMYNTGETVIIGVRQSINERKKERKTHLNPSEKDVFILSNEDRIIILSNKYKQIEEKKAAQGELL